MDNRKTFFLLAVITLVLLFSLPALFYWQTSDKYYGRPVDRPAPQFQLTDVEGKPHALADHLGRFVYLYFGYLNCNDVCHNQVGVMFNLHHQSHATDIDFIFVTMDPQRDSPELLKTYFNQFGSNFVSLTAANMQQIQKVASKYNAFFFADSDTRNGQDYEISHPGTIYLIDPEGQLRVVYGGKYLRYDKMLKDLNEIRGLE